MWWHSDTAADYPFLVPIVILLFFLAAVCGFVLGARLVRNEMLWGNRAIYLAILAYSGLWIFGQAGRSFRLGSYSDWRNGQALWFYEDRTFLTMLVVTLVVWAIPLLVYFLRMRREGKHLDRVVPSPGK